MDEGLGPRVIGRKASSGLGCCFTCGSSNFGNGKRTERGGALETGSLLDNSSFLMGSFGRCGIRGIPGSPGKLGRLGILGRLANVGSGGLRFGKGGTSESLGSPGSPIGGFVPGGMMGNILKKTIRIKQFFLINDFEDKETHPAIGLRASGKGKPRFSASSICFNSAG